MQKLAGELKDNDDRNQEIVLKILQVRTVGGMYVCMYMYVYYTYSTGVIYFTFTPVPNEGMGKRAQLQKWGREKEHAGWWWLAGFLSPYVSW